MDGWNGLGGGLGGLSRLSTARSRSITAENRLGAKGAGGMAIAGMGAGAAAELGRGWKVSPCDAIPAGGRLAIADIEGPGAIQHIWMTLVGSWRLVILRIWWDDEETPSVEVPLGDFFALGWGEFAQVDALPVNVNPARGFNCFWEMPFRARCRIALENLSDEDVTLFYQLDYVLTEVPEDCACFHAQWRRERPVREGEVYTLLDGVQGWGHYVGTVLSWGVSGPGWWGEGELKFYLDGDGEFPTLCGTGTEDYFGGGWNFELAGRYREFSAPFLGLPYVGRSGDTEPFRRRFSLYRFHVLDPIRFRSDLRVTCQVLGWDEGLERYRRRGDDVASVAFWYQTLPHAPFPELPGAELLSVH